MKSAAQTFAPISKIQPNDLVPLQTSNMTPIKNNNIVNDEVIALINTTPDNNLSSKINFSNVN